MGEARGEDPSSHPGTVAGTGSSGTAARDGNWRRDACPPALLHELAQVFLEGLAEEGLGDGPIARLASWLDGDETLVEATLAGFRSLLDRDDLPDLGQIAKLHESRRLSYFALPFLAGMAEEEREAGDPLDRFGREGKAAKRWATISSQDCPVNGTRLRTVRSSRRPLARLGTCGPWTRIPVL